MHAAGLFELDVFINSHNNVRIRRLAIARPVMSSLSTCVCSLGTKTILTSRKRTKEMTNKRMMAMTLKKMISLSNIIISVHKSLYFTFL